MATTNTTRHIREALAEHAGYAGLVREFATTNTTIHKAGGLAEHAEYAECMKMKSRKHSHAMAENAELDREEIKHRR